MCRAVISAVCMLQCVFFFFFSSRRRHTRFDCDWSSDVCSSDLALRFLLQQLGASPVRGDRDHDAFALWVLSSSERAVFNSSLRMSQKGRALLHSGNGRDRTPTCDLWHVRVVVLVMPKKVEENHGIPGRNQS